MIASAVLALPAFADGHRGAGRGGRGFHGGFRGTAYRDRSFRGHHGFRGRYFLNGVGYDGLIVYIDNCQFYFDETSGCWIPVNPGCGTTECE